jgi:RHS repeat-associated protein
VAGRRRSRASITSGAPTASTEYDPFGIVTAATPNVIDWTLGVPANGWLGAHQRPTQFGREAIGAAGPIEMGVRVYLPKVGRFLQPDPVDGGSANAYDCTAQDPISNADLDGRSIKDTGRRFVGSRLLGYGSPAYCGVKAAKQNGSRNAKNQGIQRFKGFHYYVVDAYDCLAPEPLPKLGK